MNRDNSIAVSTRGLRKQFGGNGARVEALRGVDFQARLGELTFIVGPSGCGKTTLLSVITGLLDPTVGEVGLFGEAIHRLPANDQIDFRRQNLGFVFQQYNLLPALTAAENLVGEVKLQLVEPLVLLDMGLVCISGDCHPLRRQRHLW